MDWQKLLLVTGGAAAVASVLYYLLRDEEAEAALLQEEEESKNRKELSTEDLLAVLAEIDVTQRRMKAKMKVLSKEISGSRHTFEEIYKKVHEAHPEDPLEKRGMTMADLEGPLQRDQHKKEVVQAMGKLFTPGMAASEGGASSSAKAKPIAIEKIIEINVFMLEVLSKFVKDFQANPNKDSYDKKIVAITAQAMMESQVSSRFDISSEDLDASIMSKQAELQSHQSFLETHMRMQQTLDSLLQ